MNARSRHLGENLRRLREARGWTQARLSAESGVGQPTLSGIERGRNGASLRKIEMLAVALGEFTPGLTADELWESAGSITDLTEALQTIQTASGYAKKEAGAGEAPAP